jgi:hypothetical protein
MGKKPGEFPLFFTQKSHQKYEMEVSAGVLKVLFRISNDSPFTDREFSAGSCPSISGREFRGFESGSSFAVS